MLSLALREKLLRQVFGGGSPKTYHLGLSTVRPDQDGYGFTEPADRAYRRLSVPNNSASFRWRDNQIQNAALLIYPVPSEDWGIIRSVGVFDRATGGFPVAWGELAEKIAAGTILRFEPGSLIWELQ